MKTEPIILKLVMVYLTCYFMNLFGFPDFLMLVIGAGFCLILLIKQRKIRVDLGLSLLSITMFSYCIIVFGIRAIGIMMPYIPLVIYILANYLGREFKNQKKEINLIYIVYCLVFGYAIYGILNSYMYFAGYGWEGTRYWMDFWTRSITPGTQLTICYLPVFAIFFPSLFYFYKRKWVNALIGLITLFFIYASLATRTRTTLLILALVFCGQTVLYAMLEKDKVVKNVTPKKAGIFLGCIVVMIAVLTFVLKDNEMIRAFIANLDKGGGIIHNVRFEAQALALQQLFDYPLGGYQMELGRRMAHNLWLDMANAAGLIPFFSFTAYTFWTMYELIRFIMKKDIGTEIKIMFSGIYAAFFLYYTVEPALMASVHFLCPWMLINGLIHGYLSDSGVYIKHCTEK